MQKASSAIMVRLFCLQNGVGSNKEFDKSIARASIVGQNKIMSILFAK